LLCAGSCVLGACRPLVEISLMLQPRRGHADGRSTAQLLNAAFVLRTLTAAVFLPLLLHWGRGYQHQQLQVWLNSVARVWALLLQPLGETSSDAGMALSLLPVILSALPMLALVPWNASANHQQPFKHPVRRALHYAPPIQTFAGGGPAIPSRPVVDQVGPRKIALRWRSPHCAGMRSLLYDIEASIEGGSWVSGSQLDVQPAG